MNIAELGIRVLTGQLKEAKASLEALIPSAQRAERATENFNAAANGTKAAGNAAASGVKNFQNAAQGATGSTTNLTNTAMRQTSIIATLRARWQAFVAQLTQTPAAAAGATSSLNRLGAAANDNINRLQSTPGNIAAQFQDIGVTAAGGMNPLLIALQQGTQLSSAFAGGFKDLFAGFRQLFSLTTLLTVGLVGLAAAGLQMIDWMQVGKSLLLFLADAMETCAVAAAYLGVVLAIAFAPQILARIGAMVTSIVTGLIPAIGGATSAMLMFAIANPFTAIVLAIGAVIGILYVLSEQFGGVFTDIIDGVKWVANGIIRFFAMAWNTVLRGAQETVNVLIDAFSALSGFLGLDVSIGRVDFSAATIDTSRQDFVGDIADWVGAQAGRAADWMRGLAGGMGASTPESDGNKRQREQIDQIAKAYDDLIASTERRIAALRTETTALGMSERAGMLFRNQQELIAQAMEKNIPLTDAVRANLERLAQALTSAQIDQNVARATRAFEEQQRALQEQAQLIGLTGTELEYTRIRQELLNEAVQGGVVDLNNMTDAMRAYIGTLNERAMLLAQQTSSNSSGTFMASVSRDRESTLASMQRERGELNLLGRDLIAYRRETEILNSARSKGIELGTADLEVIRQTAQEYALVREETDMLRMRTELFRDAQMGFVTDLLNGLRQGESAWKAFANAVLNVANQIFNKLFEVVSSSVFQQFTNPSGGGTGGLFGAIGRAFGSFVGRGPSAALGGSATAAIDANPNLFARGGAFTNEIYSKPTLFKYANGGAFGQMGEAGPEAVMPLKRGPNGSLGVVAHDREPVRVVISTNDDRFNAYVDERSGRQIEAAAPAIASAGSTAAQRTGAWKSSRRIG